MQRRSFLALLAGLVLPWKVLKPMRSVVEPTEYGPVRVFARLPYRADEWDEAPFGHLCQLTKDGLQPLHSRYRRGSRDPNTAQWSTDGLNWKAM